MAADVSADDSRELLSPLAFSALVFLMLTGLCPVSVGHLPVRYPPTRPGSSPNSVAPAACGKSANSPSASLASHLSGWSAYDNVYATATSLSGTWCAFKNFGPAGTETYPTQTTNITPVTGSQGTTYICAGDRWTTANLGTSPLIWLPLDLSGDTVNVGWRNSWTLDMPTGTWSGTSNPTSGTTRYPTNANSGLVMDVSGASTADGGVMS